MVKLYVWLHYPDIGLDTSVFPTRDDLVQVFENVTGVPLLVDHKLTELVGKVVSASIREKDVIIKVLISDEDAPNQQLVIDTIAAIQLGEMKHFSVGVTHIVDGVKVLVELSFTSAPLINGCDILGWNVKDALEGMTFAGDKPDKEWFYPVYAASRRVNLPRVAKRSKPTIRPGVFIAVKLDQ